MQVSGLKLSKFSFRSTIKRFSRRCDPVGERLISGSVSVDEQDHLKWSVQLYPNGFNESCQDHLSLFAAFQSSDKKVTQTRRVEFSIIDAKGQKRNRISFEDTFTPSLGRGFGKFVSRKRLHSQSDELLPDDTLTICCQVEDVGETESEQLAKRAKLQVADDLRKHVTGGSYSDVTFTVSGRQFPAHKVLLAARSPVFAAMFRPGMRESHTNRVDVPDIDSDVFEELLHFIYTGETSSVDQMAQQLLAAADKYDVRDLKLICEDVLTKQLTVDNCVKTLIFADIHSADKLKQKCVEYIVQRASAVVDTNEWNAMSQHPKLLNQVCVLLAKSCQLKKH